MYKKYVALLLLFFTCNIKSMHLSCCCSCGKQTNKKSLHYAAQKGDTKRIKKLLRKDNIDIDIKNNDEETPLFVAIKNNKAKAAALLLNKGANPNTHNKEGETPLMHTIDKELPQCAILLLDKGARPIIGKNNLESYLVDFYGETPTHETIKENYKFLAPVHSYLLNRKLTPLYELQQNEQRSLNQTTLPLSNNDI